MEYIDTLLATSANTAKFTVDIAAVNKRVSVTDSTAPCFMVNASGNPYFQKNDNLVILTAGYYIPESFITTLNPGTPVVLPVLRLGVYDPDGDPIGNMPGLGNLGNIILPFENYEGVYNIYSDIASLTVDTLYKVSGVLFFNSCMISMVNVPADLDGREFKIYPFIKVAHTMPMQAS